MAKLLVTVVKMQLPAGKANPAPPVGTALGPHGINLPGFCNEFNNATKEMGDTIVPIEISIFDDRSYSFIMKSPPAAVLIRKAINIPKGSASPNKDKVGTITRAQLEEIAKIKQKDLSANDLDAEIGRAHV